MNLENLPFPQGPPHLEQANAITVADEELGAIEVVHQSREVRPVSRTDAAGRQMDIHGLSAQRKQKRNVSLSGRASIDRYRSHNRNSWFDSSHTNSADRMRLSLQFTPRTEGVGIA
ncbi:MAG: hypothetical protein H0T88_01000 [Lysobacter sp.]|nr:hypothetical protein [Lysobacter sp.]